MTNRRERTWAVWTLAGVALAVLLRLLMIDVPFDRDEGGYAYIGWQWTQGLWPYVHSVESKPPGVFAVYAILVGLYHGVTSVRLGMLLWSLLTALVFHRLVRRLFDAPTAAIATILLALTQTAPSYDGQSANAEMFMVTWIIAALLMVAPGGNKQQSWRPVAAGALMGIAVLFKPVAGADLLPLVVMIYATAGAGRKFVIRILYAAGGFCAALAACYAAFALAGAAREFHFWAFSYNLSYSGAFSWLDRGRALAIQLSRRGMLVRDWPLLVGLAAGVIVLWRGRRENKIAALALPFWLFSAAVGVAASGRFTAHYWQQLLPPLCLAAAVGVRGAVGLLLEKTASTASRAAIIVVIALLLLSPTLLRLPQYTRGAELSRDLFGVNPFYDGEMLGRYLREHTEPDETVLVFGSEGQILFHARRRSAMRFVFAYPLAAYYEDTLALQQEAWREIQDSQPRYVVVVNMPSSMTLNKNAPPFLREHLQQWVGSNCRLEASLTQTPAGNTELVISHPPRGVVELYRRLD